MELDGDEARSRVSGSHKSLSFRGGARRERIVSFRAMASFHGS